LFASENKSQNETFTSAYLIMLVYRRLFNYACLQALVNNNPYMASSCVIANYNRKTSEIYLFKRVILLF